MKVLKQIIQHLALLQQVIFSTNIRITQHQPFQMKNLFLLSFVFFLFQNTVFAQENTNPATKAILDKVKQKYTALKSMQLDFKLEIKVSENKKSDIQMGSLKQQGTKYRVDLNNGGQILISDGMTNWLVINNKKDVQITNAKGKGKDGFLSPQDLLKMYENKEYIGVTEADATENGKKCTIVKLKPTNKNKSDYSFIKLAIDKSNNTLVSVMANDRNNVSSYIMTINKLTTNPSFVASEFTFDKKKFPNAKVQDLRVD